jgi:predicted dehydrogenase
LVLRVGVIGLDGWFFPQTYAKVLTQASSVRLISGAHLGVTDEKLEISTPGYNKERFAKEFHIKLYDSIEKMIQKEQLEAVVICGEYCRKADYVEEAAENGVDILLEKPPASTMDDMDRIVRAEQKNKVKVAVATARPYAEFGSGVLFKEAYRKIKEGIIGNPLCIRMVRQHGKLYLEDDLNPYFWEPFNSDHWYLKKENRGPELSLGWYASDFLRWFMGSEVIRVYAEYENYITPKSPFMDNGKATVKFKNGSIGSVDLYFSVEWPFPLTSVEIVGTKGNMYAVLGHTEKTITIYNKEGIYSQVFPWDGANDDLLDYEVENWVKTLIERIPLTPPLSAIEARSVLEVCIGWERSAKTNNVINLPLKKL